MTTVAQDSTPGTMTGARAWHGLVALVAIGALVLRLVLVVRGDSVLQPTEQPSLGERLVRFISYFTILSNLLVAYTSVTLTLQPLRRGRVWTVVRLNAVVAIAVPGVIHWFFLRPLLHLQGASYVADKLLHLAVPLLAVAGWLAFGPRGSITSRTVRLSLIYPIAWIAYTLVRGVQSGWYPYPFVDVDAHGHGRVSANCVAIALLLLALSYAAMYGDRRLPRR